MSEVIKNRWLEVKLATRDNPIYINSSCVSCMGVFTEKHSKGEVDRGFIGLIGEENPIENITHIRVMHNPYDDDIGEIVNECNKKLKLVELKKD